MLDLRSRRRRSALRVLTSGAAVLALTGVAAAQSDAAPPDPALQQTYPVWLAYLVMFVLAAALLGASFMPSKRGHQD